MISSSFSLSTNTKTRFIVFVPIELSQGYGNIMNGLLAAHLLGVEFQRTVCLTSSMSSFLTAFEAIDPTAVRECPRLLQNLPPSTYENSVSLVNFYPPPNECIVKDTLANRKLPVIYLKANTYPRWPSIPQKDFFFRFYRPRSSFLQKLPYNPSQPPQTVVHLRLADGSQDPRAGLDEATFQALGALLPRNTTWLVTNHVPWFDYFAQHYGWQHPQWHKVTHSAGLDTQNWGERRHRKSSHHKLSNDGTKQQELQVWMDWFTVLRAKTVYHTHSDFSISAIHWQDIQDSKSISGVASKNGNNGGSLSQQPHTLQLLEESWRRDGETEPLIERTKRASGRRQLRLCSSPSGQLLGPLYVTP